MVSLVFYNTIALLSLFSFGDKKIMFTIKQVNYQSNICLIGGTGYLGAAFKNMYASEYNKVITLGRKKNVSGLQKNEQYYSISGLSTSEIASILERNEIGTVIDFAYCTVPKTSFEHPVEDFSENLLLVNKHLEAIKRAGNCTYIYISSGGTVYGNANNAPINEKYQNFPLSPYGITKMACERYVNMYHHMYGFSVMIIRPSNIYGPGQMPFKGQGFIPTALASVYKSQCVPVFGDGSHVRDYLYIDDFCQALHDVVCFGKEGEIYNVGSSEGNTLNDVIRHINQVTSKCYKTLQISNLPERRFDVTYNVLDNQKLMKLNSWKRKVNMEEGLRQTWSWMERYMITCESQKIAQ